MLCSHAIKPGHRCARDGRGKRFDRWYRWCCWQKALSVAIRGYDRWLGPAGCTSRNGGSKRHAGSRSSRERNREVRAAGECELQVLDHSSAVRQSRWPRWIRRRSPGWGSLSTRRADDQKALQGKTVRRPGSVHRRACRTDHLVHRTTRYANDHRDAEPTTNHRSSLMWEAAPVATMPR
jgi:hypothetical protein